MLKELATAIYYVDDLTDAKQWFKRIFEIEPYYDVPPYVGYSVNGYELGIMPNDVAQPHLTYLKTTCYWRVDDIEVALSELVARGAEIGEPVMDVGDGIKVGSIKDPSGNHFGLIENHHFNTSDIG